MSLPDVIYTEINPERKKGKGLMTNKVVVEVPIGTKKCHVAVSTMQFCFGGLTHPTTHPLSEFRYEMVNQDESELPKGKYKFDFNAILRTKDPDVEWSGYFILETLCLG